MFSALTAEISAIEMDADLVGRRWRDNIDGCAVTDTVCLEEGLDVLVGGDPIDQP